MSNQLEWIDGQPYHIAYGDRYFSDQGGLPETQHVFLNGNKLAERFAALPATGTFVVAELGFGTGLNFLATALLFQQAAPSGAHLQFYSLEKHPLSPEDIQQALNTWPELTPLLKALLENYPSDLADGDYTLSVGNNISLHLSVGDVAEILPRWTIPADAWFLDGHSPSKNPAMWSPEVLARVCELTKQNGTFATFAAAVVVQKALTAAGFEIAKTKGFGTKREMLTGTKQAWRYQPAFATIRIMQIPSNEISVTEFTERYIVFVKDMQTSEEFTIAKMGKPNDYAAIQAQATEKYKYPHYQIHMVYTQADLENIIKTLNRWYGTVSTSQAIAKQRANDAKIQQALMERQEWDNLVAAHKARQQEKKNFVQKAIALDELTTPTPQKAEETVKPTPTMATPTTEPKTENATVSASAPRTVHASPAHTFNSTNTLIDRLMSNKAEAVTPGEIQKRRSPWAVA